MDSEPCFKNQEMEHKASRFAIQVICLPSEETSKTRPSHCESLEIDSVELSPRISMVESI